MASTYSQIYIHLIFAVKGRRSLIHSSWEEELYKYTTGIIQNKGQKLLAINGIADHIHVLIGMKPVCCISDLVREIKKSTYELVNKEKFSKYKFQWQEGYGAFSCSHSSIKNVIEYIQNQKEHHRKKTFKEEYVSFLSHYNVPFQPEYLFEFIEPSNE